MCCGEEVRCLFKGGRGEEKVCVYGVGVEKIIVRWKGGRVGGQVYSVIRTFVIERMPAMVADHMRRSTYR